MRDIPKRIVRCAYCKQPFDINEEPFVQVQGRRYAHKHCEEEYQNSSAAKEKRDLLKLHGHIKRILGISDIPAKIVKQIGDYVTEYHYTYEGIARALAYFYEVKQNSIEKAMGGIGIVPYVHDEAREYYYTKWLVQQLGQDRPIEEYKARQVEIKIQTPKSKSMKKKTFQFLDD